MPKPALLLVDDEPYILTSLRQVFRREPYKILTAETGKEALDILRGRHIDILISDHRMPGMTGLRLLQEARRLQPGIFRILISGYVDEEDILTACHDGDVQRFICKPWEVEDLLADVRAILEARDGGQGEE